MYPLPFMPRPSVPERADLIGAGHRAVYISWLRGLSYARTVDNALATDIAALWHRSRIQWRRMVASHDPFAVYEAKAGRAAFARWLADGGDPVAPLHTWKDLEPIARALLGAEVSIAPTATAVPNTVPR